MGEISIIIAVFYTFLVSFFLSVILNRLSIVAAQKLGIVDMPDARKIHSHPIPRWGGSAIFASFWIVLLAEMGFKVSPIILPLLIGSSILFITGTIDDKRGINAWIKLFIQIIASATFVFMTGVKFPLVSLAPGIIIVFPRWLAYALAIIWITGVINAFNLIDGLDGLASGLAIIALTGFAIFSTQLTTAIISIILAASILGFVFYNYPPALEFMGDSGSTFIGYIIGILSLITGGKYYSFFSIFLPLALILIPVLDVSWAFIRRIANREPPFKPDKMHIHHRLLRLNFEKTEVLVTLLAISAFTAFAAMVLSRFKSAALLLFIMTLISGVIIFLLTAAEYLKLPQLINDARILSNKIVSIRLQKRKPVLIEIVATLLIIGYYFWIIYRTVGLTHIIVIIDIATLLVIAFVTYEGIRLQRKIGVVLLLSGLLLLVNYLVYLFILPDFSLFYARKDIILLFIMLYLVYEIGFLFYVHVLIPLPEDVIFGFILMSISYYLSSKIPSWWTIPLVVGIMYLGVKLTFIKLEEWGQLKD